MLVHLCLLLPLVFAASSPCLQDQCQETTSVLLGGVRYCCSGPNEVLSYSIAHEFRGTTVKCTCEECQNDEKEQCDNQDQCPTLGCSGDFKCSDGNGVISWDRVDDDFCDCPDGSDEPNSPACAPDGRFLCRDKKEPVIFSSHVRDGVCDCCDGSDEAPGHCTDVCVEKYAEQKRLQDEHIASLVLGFAANARLLSTNTAKYKPHNITQYSLNVKNLQNDLDTTTQEIAVASAKYQAQVLSASSKHEVPEHLDKLRVLLGLDELSSDVVQNVIDGMKAYNRFEECFELLQTETKDSTADTTTLIKQLLQCAIRSDRLLALHTNLGDLRKKDAAKNEADAESQQKNEVEEMENVRDALKLYSVKVDRHEVKKLEDSLGLIKGETKKAEERLSSGIRDNKIDFGDDSSLRSMYKECISHKVDKYSYNICPFNKVSQGTTSLGEYSSHTFPLLFLSDENSPSNGQFQEMPSVLMYFNNGTPCPNNIRRSATLQLFCSKDFKVMNVEEPATCEYVIEMRTPSACLKHMTELYDISTEQLTVSEVFLVWSVMKDWFKGFTVLHAGLALCCIVVVFAIGLIVYLLCTSLEEGEKQTPALKQQEESNGVVEDE